MKINLTDGYFITEDNYNYTLMQSYIGVGRKDKKEKMLTRTVGHYSNGIKGLKGCVKRYLEECTVDAEKSAELTLKQFCDHLERLVDKKSEYIADNFARLIEK